MFLLQRIIVRFGCSPRSYFQDIFILLRYLAKPLCGSWYRNTKFLPTPLLSRVSTCLPSQKALSDGCLLKLKNDFLLLGFSRRLWNCGTAPGQAGNVVCWGPGEGGGSPGDFSSPRLPVPPGQSRAGEPAKGSSRTQPKPGSLHTQVTVWILHYSVLALSSSAAFSNSLAPTHFFPLLPHRYPLILFSPGPSFPVISISQLLFFPLSWPLT